MIGTTGSNPPPFWASSLAAGFGGPVAGFGVTVLVYQVLETRARAGIPPGWFLIAALIAFAAYGAFSLVHDPVVRRLARSTLAVAGFLLLACSVVFWEGHAGGYYQIAPMRYTLRSVVRIQDSLWNAAGRYSAGPLDDFYPDGRVIGPTIALTADGWTATVGHRQTPRTCAVFVGSTPLPPAKTEHQVACTFGRLSFARAGIPLALLLGGLLVGSVGVWRRR